MRKYSKSIEAKDEPNKHVKIIEIDGLYIFVKRKNRIYVITLLIRDKRQIVGYNTAFDKSRERIQKLVDSSPKADYYYFVYSKICYYGTHTALKKESDLYYKEYKFRFKTLYTSSS